VHVDIAHDETPAAAKRSHWLLKSAKAIKLGKYSDGSIAYQVQADTDRVELFITITGNDGGGYYSRERVPLQKVEACLGKCEAGKPFPSKALKDAFVGRSSNNAGFMVAVLRAEGLLCAAPSAETQHALAGDWDAWKKTMLAEPGEPVEVDSNQIGAQPGDTPTEAQQPGHRKTQKQPATKKA
jgi:hypothetical protein